MKRRRFYFTRKYYPIFESSNASDDDDVLDLTMAGMALKEHSIIPVKQSDGKLKELSGNREPEFISGLHQVARALVWYKENCYEVVEVRRKPRIALKIKLKELGLDVKHAFGDDLQLACYEYPAHELSPVLKVFCELQFAAAEILRLFRTYDTQDEVKQALWFIDRSIRKLRFIVRLAVGRHKTFCRNPRRNFSNITGAIEDAGQFSQWINSGRVDLFIGQNEHRFKPTHKAPTRADWIKLRGYRRKFVRHVQNRFKGILLRMFVKLEYGRDRFLHLHVWILLNGQLYKEDMSDVMEQLGAQWERITGGEGTFTNVHRIHRKPLRFNAIGLVNVRERDVQIGFQKLAAYFTLADAFVKLYIDEVELETFAIFGPELTPKPGAYRPVLRMSFKEAMDTISYM